MGRYAILAACTANICRSPLMEMLRHLGEDTGEFRSRPLTVKIAEIADLILTAAREHHTGVVSVSSTALRCTFILREFGARARCMVFLNVAYDEIELPGTSLTLETDPRRGENTTP